MRTHHLTSDTTDTDDGPVFVPAASAVHIAEQLAMVARAGCRLAAEADHVLTCGAPVTEATVGRLEALAVELRAAVEVRAELAAADPDLLLAGARQLCRTRPAPPWPPGPVPYRAGGHDRAGQRR